MKIKRATLSCLLGTLLVSGRPVWALETDQLAEANRAFYRGEHEQAETLTERYLKAHPQSSQGRVLLARALMSRGQYSLAFQELRTALGFNAEDEDVLYYLGQVCVVLSQLEFRELFSMAPDSARVHQLMAESYRAQEKLDKAEEEYQAALKVNPQLVDVLVALGGLTRSKFRFVDAISYYSAALRLEPGNYEAAYGLGASYLYEQDPRRAITYLRQALAADPRSAACRLALGDALLRNGQPSEAVSELKAALDLEPKMRQAYTLLGKAHQRLGQPELARTAFKKAQELIESEVEARNRQKSSPIVATPSKENETSGNH